MNKFLNILCTIIGIPLGILGAICIAPFVVLYLLIDLPCMIVQDIWGVGGQEDE